MIEKYFQGVIPEVASDDDELKGASRVTHDKLGHEMDNLQFSRALEVVWEFIARVNRFIEEKKPWVERVGAQIEDRIRSIIAAGRGGDGRESGVVPER